MGGIKSFKQGANTTLIVFQKGYFGGKVKVGLGMQRKQEAER